jgi:hypothetical protein
MLNHSSARGRWHAALLIPFVSLLTTAVFLPMLGRRTPPLPPARDSWAARGQRVFIARKCYACHTLHEKPSEGQTDLAEAAKLDAVQLRQWLANPMAMKPRTIMPHQSLDGEEMTALVAFIRSLSNPQSAIRNLKSEIPTVPASHQVSGWILHHGQELLKNTQDCFKSGCHTQASFCGDCHRTRLPNSHVLNPDDEPFSRQIWMQQHGGAAIAAFLTESRTDVPARSANLSDSLNTKAAFCLTCHHEGRDCDECHAVLSHRPMTWARREGGAISARNAKLSRHAEVFNRHPASESRCFDCHTRPKLECDTCHGLPMPHPGKGGTYARQPHRADAAMNPGLCAKCHTQQYCDDCHFEKRPTAQFANWTHRRKEAWLNHHDEAATNNAARCNVCHLPGRSTNAPLAMRDCNGCHGLEMPHPSNWTLIGHGEELKKIGVDSSREIRGSLSCFRCHTPQTKTYCDKCHDPTWRMSQ